MLHRQTRAAVPHFRILSFLFIFCFLFPQPATARTLYGRVIKVFDGDTFLIRVERREEHVRLREIDAPEIMHRRKIGQEPWGGRARVFADRLVRGRAVRLETDDREERDKYYRLLAYVWTGGLLVNREMVASGNAFFYPVGFLGRYAPELERAEAMARERHLGVWEPRNGLTELPQDFRRRTNRDDGSFSRFVRIAREEKKKPSGEQNFWPPDQVVGNKRSKIYHLPGSAAAAKVSPRNRVFFDSPEEAERAGYRPAGEKKS